MFQNKLHSWRRLTRQTVLLSFVSTYTDCLLIFGSKIIELLRVRSGLNIDMDRIP